MRTEHNAQRGIIAREHKARDAPLVERHVPAHSHIVPRLHGARHTSSHKSPTSAIKRHAQHGAHMLYRLPQIFDASRATIQYSHVAQIVMATRMACIAHVTARCPGSRAAPAPPSWRGRRRPPAPRAAQTRSGRRMHHHTCPFPHFLKALLLQTFSDTPTSAA